MITLFALLQGILTVAWQACVVLIGLLVCLIAYTEQFPAQALPQVRS